MSHLSQPSRAHIVGRAATLSRAALVAALVLTIGLLLWPVAERLGALLAYPYPHDTLEGTLLYEGRLLLAGEPLYQPLELYRFVAAPYPPVHPLLVGLADLVSGPHLFWSARLVSLVAAVGAAVFAGLTARQAGGSWAGAALAAALLLAAPPLILWGTRVKPDALALFWTALGLWLASLAFTTDNDRQLSTDNVGRSRGGAGRWSLAGAALAFALALFTKQTAAAAPLAVGLALLSADVQDWRGGARAGYLRRLPVRQRTLLFGLTYLGLVGVVWAALDLVYGGQFTFHVVTMHRRASWSLQLMGKYVELLWAYWPLMLLVPPLLVLAARERRALIVGWYLVCAPLTLFGAGKTGANHNHLLETILALVLVAGVAAGWALRALPRRPAAASAIAGLLAIQLVLAFSPPAWYRGELEPGETPARFLEFMRATPGEILADDASLLLLAGKPLRYDDASGMGPVAISGLWDQRGLLDDITNRRFSAIMIPVNVEREDYDHAARWSPEVIAAIREHYRMLYRDRIITYVPR